MNKLYYTSADEAASQLGLPLLLAAASSVAVPRLGVRLSDHAPDTVLGARLYHRLNVTETSEPLVLWVVSPRETVEHLGWAVGIAEHAARTGKTAYLFDLDRSSLMRALVSGDGHPLPSSVRARIERLLVRAAAVWSSDLQGVRIALPVVRVPAGEPMEAPAEWALVIASSLPESAQEVRRIATEADGVVLTAGIRDHPRQELESIVSALSKAGSSMLGLVAMGPVPRKGKTPLDRWTEPDYVKLGPHKEKPKPPEVSEREEQVGKKEPVGSGEMEWETEAAGEEQPAEPAPTSVDLVAGWQSRAQPKKGSRRYLLVLVVAVIVAGVGWIVTNYMDLPFLPKQKRPPIAADSTATAAEREKDVEEQEPVAVAYRPVIAQDTVPAGPEAWEAAADSMVAAVDSLQLSVLSELEEWPGDTIPIETEPTALIAGPDDAAADSFIAQVVEEGDTPRRSAELVDAEPVRTGEADSAGVHAMPEAIAPEPEMSEITGGGALDTIGSSVPQAVVQTVLDTIAQDLSGITEATQTDTAGRDVPEPSDAAAPTVTEQEALGINVADIPDTTILETLLARGESFGIPWLEDVIQGKNAAWPDTFAVHVSSFRSSADAEPEVARLQRAGLPARIVSVIIPGKGRWDRVVVGSYSDSAAAAAAAARIIEGGLVTYAQVLNHNGVGKFQRAGSR